jgi:DNA-binding PadR family transcriptional regulator
MHGHALVQYIQQRSEKLLHVEEDSLSGLTTMMKEGLVKAEWKISPSNRRVRNYRITSPLREVLSP